ncbi:MAG: MFS transporter [Methylococcaceae bacterium]|nr:MAG: MFS transporter [Methylococcaceae bacterium]
MCRPFKKPERYRFAAALVGGAHPADQPPRVPYWRLSGFYFFYFAALGALLPYWPVYLQSLGYDPGRIGVLMAILAGTKIIAPNIWSWIADHSGRPLTVIRLGALCAVLSFCALYGNRDYTAMALLTGAYSFFWNAALPAFEAITLHHLQEQSERYSRVRLWGSIGFIGGVLAVGGLLSLFPIADLPYAILAMLINMWLTSLLVPAGKAMARQADTPRFWHLLWRGEVLAFLLVSFLVQVAHGPYYVFFTVYLKSHGYSDGAVGWMWSLGVIAEIVLFWCVTHWLKRVALRQLLLSGLLLGSLRWWVIPLVVDQPWLLAASQLLHAATFGITHVVAIHLMHRHFSGVHHNKGQALYNSTSFGAGGMLGSYLSGALWLSWGATWEFQAAAWVSLSALLIAWFGVGRSAKKDRRR